MSHTKKYLILMIKYLVMVLIDQKYGIQKQILKNLFTF